MIITGIIMAFDYGTKNIGIAVGQTLTYNAQPIYVSKSKYGIPDWKNIEYIYDEWRPIKLIVGLPLKINGNEQLITILSRNFAAQLQKKFKIAVEMYDERFSTIEARSKILINYKNNLQKKHPCQINSIAAAIILKSWLNQTLYLNKQKHIY